MKKVLITAVLFVAFSTVKGQEDKLYFKHKSDVMTLLTLDEEVREIRSGINNDSAFYYAVLLEDETFIGYYFDKNDTCNIIVYRLDFNSYRKKLKEFTTESQDENSNVEAYKSDVFTLKDSSYVAFFSIEEDIYLIKWVSMNYNYDFPDE